MRIDEDGEMRWRPMWRPIRHKRRETVDLRWITARSWTNRWYPQGIDLGQWHGRKTLAVSWFQQDKSRTHLASRVSFVDLERARHLDVALVIDDGAGGVQPAQIHAGGLAWFEDRLFVAATGQGIWEFDLAAIRRDRGSLAVVRTHVHPVALRCSYLGRVFDADGNALRRVLIGEYRTDESGQIGEFALPEGAHGGFEELDRFTPGIPRMQGAVRWGERYFASQSDGTLPGTLWSGPRDALQPGRIPLPPGCQDLALDPDAGRLWSLGEHPWRRVVRGIPLARLGVTRT